MYSFLIKLIILFFYYFLFTHHDNNTGDRSSRSNANERNNDLEHLDLKPRLWAFLKVRGELVASFDRKKRPLMIDRIREAVASASVSRLHHSGMVYL